MTAKVVAFGIVTVRDALESWRKSLHEVQIKVREVQRRDHRGTGDWFEPWVELDETAKPAELEARRQL